MPNEPYNLLSRYKMIEEALSDVRLSKGDCAVLSVILSHVDADGEAWPGMKRICDRARIQKRSAIRSVQRLEDAGYLTVDRVTGRSNTYQLIVHRSQTGVANVTS
ncbi:helix-turn-helix domain-containing protein [Pseudoxanthomonas sp. JBR18]|uniref:helix-turn-helix domain-containing protein n=1 Tax=Pseudoxanthomonas sp. JBR18 TaxID=2969308 RepID=UPI002305589B|nr:helix-turn-helix domain-containing protein [Pseudoxanthomonas sp. JBR18]WCE03164.1 helix-turn-helix domain-containing protein [Pseudoxanthomonas sp. JBR18]